MSFTEYHPYGELLEQRAEIERLREELNEAWAQNDLAWAKLNPLDT
jgi:hypothetical protein